MGKYRTGPDLVDDISDLQRGQLRLAGGGMLGDVADPGEDGQDPDGTPGAGPSIAAPTGLSLSTDVFLDNYQGKAVANVTAVWNPVTNNSPKEVNLETADPDRSPISDYLVSYRVGAGVWSREGGTGGLTTVKFTLLPIGEVIYVRVRARTKAGQVGAYATASITAARDTVAPPKPSVPVIVGTLRGVSVRWNGLFAVDPATSAPYPRPPDFAYVIAEVSLTSDFTTVIKGGVMSEAGQTAVAPIGTAPFTVWARLVAVDNSGNRSAVSDAATGGSIVIVPEDIGGGAVTTAALAAAAVTASKILDGAVVGAKLADLSVSVAKIVDGAITAAKTSLSAIDPSSGTLAINAVAANNIVAGAVVAGKIATDAVVANNIVAGAVIAEKIAANAVVADKINALAVTTEKINAGAVTTLKVAANSITAGEIAAGAVTADELYSTAVTGKIITGGTFRTGVSGEDRIEIIDQVVFDSYLGYNRSIQDTIRWIRGGDGALVGEIRGYMGDIGAYGIHLNSNVEIGNIQSTIYQVGRRAASAPNQHVRVRAAHFSHTTTGGEVVVDFNTMMDNVPSVILVTTEQQWSFWVRGKSSSGFAMPVIYPVGHALAGQSPGDGAVVSGWYYAEDFV